MSDRRLVAHSCPHCGRGIPLDQRTTRCRGCGGDLTLVLSRRQPGNLGCLTGFGFGMAGALTGSLISLVVLFLLRPRPLWKLDEHDLAAVVVFGAGGAMLGSIVAATTGVWLSLDQRVRFEAVLVFLTGAAAGLLVMLLAGLPPKHAAATGVPMGLAAGGVLWFAAQRQRERDFAELQARATDNTHPPTG